MNYLIGWISTIAATSIIRTFMMLNMLKDIADNGYKLNTKKMHEESISLSSSDDTASDKIVDYIPLVNMISSFADYTSYLCNREDILTALYQLNTFEEMSKEEKEEYNKKHNAISVIKLYSNEAVRKQNEYKERELQYSLEKIHQMHIMEDYMKYFDTYEKALEEYEKDKAVRLSEDDRYFEEKLKDYRYIDLKEDGKIYYTIDDDKSIYGLDDFRVVYIEGKYKTEEVTFNERKAGYFLSVVDNDFYNENSADKVNIIRK